MEIIINFRLFINDEINYSTFIKNIKSLYLTYCLGDKKPDDLFILSSCAIIDYMNEPKELTQSAIICLASKILKETGDADAVRLLLCVTPITNKAMRKIIMCHSTTNLQKYVKPFLLEKKYSTKVNERLYNNI